MDEQHPHSHGGIYFFGPSVRFLKLSLFMCVYRRAVKQLKTLEGNANDPVSSQSKHWEIKLSNFKSAASSMSLAGFCARAHARVLP